MGRGRVVAVLVTLAACSSGSRSFISATTTSSGQATRITSLAHGTLRGPGGGTIVFRPDGTATATFVLCGTSSLSTQPFGVDCSGSPDTPVTGKDTIGDQSITIAGADGSSTTWKAYVDGQGRLHIGTGTLGTMTPDHQADVSLGGASDVVLHVHGTCSWDAASGTDHALHPTPCRIEKQNGVTVLTATVPDSFDATKTTTLTLVYDAGLLVEPALWADVFNPAS